MLMIVLGGVVTGSFFSALVALVTYIADPNTTLPAIVFWLLGSVATATFAKVAVALVPVLGGAAVLVALRWRINVLSLGDEDAAALGVSPVRCAGWCWWRWRSLWPARSRSAARSAGWAW